MASYLTKRERKKQECEQRIRRIHAKHPDLAKVDGQMNHLAIVTARAVAKGNVDTAATDREYQLLRQKRTELLKRYGLSEADYEPQWDCPICQDRGYVRPGVPCACQSHEKLETMFLASGIPSKYRRMTFETFDVNVYFDPMDVAQKVERCKQFVTMLAMDKPMGNLILSGDVGRGKTHLSVAIANAAMECGLTVVYKRVDDLLDFIRSVKFDRAAEDTEAERIFHLLFSCDLLVLDDLGSESPTDFAVGELTNILEDRNLANRSWIINTNIPTDDLERIYGSRLVDRIIEKARIFRLDSEESMRRRRDPADVTMI